MIMSEYLGIGSPFVGALLGWFRVEAALPRGHTNFKISMSSRVGVCYRNEAAYTYGQILTRLF